MAIGTDDTNVSVTQLLRERYLNGDVVVDAEAAAEFGRSRGLPGHVRKALNAEGHEFRRINAGTYVLESPRKAARRPMHAEVSIPWGGAGSEVPIPLLGATMTVAALELVEAGVQVTLLDNTTKEPLVAIL